MLSSALFRARLLGYLIGLLPLLGLLLLFRQAAPQWVALLLTTGGFYFSMQLQQKARRQFPYNFRDRAEWLALGVYAALVLVLVLVLGIQYW